MLLMLLFVFRPAESRFKHTLYRVKVIFKSSIHSSSSSSCQFLKYLLACF